MITITIAGLSAMPLEDRQRIALFVCPELDTRVTSVRSFGAEHSAADIVAPFDLAVPGADKTVIANVPPPTAPIVVVAEVPPPPAAPVAPVAGSTELDSAGLPWDARIHAETRAKIGDGTWRYRRNCDKELIATVEAELRGIAAAPASAVYVGDGTGLHSVGAEVVPGLNADPNVIPPAGCHPTPVASVAQVAVEVPPIPAPVVNTSLPGNDFAALMEHITPLMAAGKITTAQMVDAVKELGLPHIGALAQRADLIPEMRKKVDVLVGVV